MANVVETVFRGVDEISGNVAQINSGISKLGVSVSGIAGAFRQLLAIGGAVQLARSFVTASDEMQEMNETVAQFRDTQEDVLRTQQSLARISIATDTAYAKTFELYARLGLESQKLGLNESDRLKIVEAINQAQQLAGPLARDVGAAFQRIVQSGEVSGQTLVRTLGGAPRLLKAIADEFADGNTTALKKLAEEGKLTADAVFGAIANQAAAIGTDFQKTGQTVSESLTNIGTAWQQLMTTADSASGIAEFMANRLQAAAEILAALGRAATPGDTINKALIDSSTKLNEALEAQFILRQSINALSESGEGSRELDMMIIELERTEQFLPALRQEVELLQAAFNRAAEAARKADEAKKDALAADVYVGKAGELVRSLEEQFKLFGENERAVLAYKLETMNATPAQKEFALATYDKIDALKREQEALLATADAFSLGAGQEGPVRETTPGLDELAGMTEQARRGWDVMGGYAKDAAEKASTAWDEATRNIQGVLADFLFDPFEDGVEGMVKGFADAIRRMIANALAAQLMEKLFPKTSSGGGGNLFSTIFGAIVGAKTGGVGGGAGSPRAAGGWTTPGAMHPINEVEPEFLLTAGRDRVVPLSKMAANGLSGGRSVVYAPQNTTHVQLAMNPAEFEQLMRRREEATLARWREMERDGAFT